MGRGHRLPRLKRGCRLALVLGTCFAASPALAQDKPGVNALAVGALSITTTPISSFGRGGTESDTGRLTWRGGLLLQSKHPNFGGWSGLDLSADGRRFLAISDAGAWMSGEIVYKGDAPASIARSRIGPLLTRDGKALKRGRDRDAEAIAVESGTLDKGSILVAFEQNARIARYDFSRDGVSATRAFLTLPDAVRRLRRKDGLEAMTLLKGGPHKGAIVAFPERLRAGQDHHTGWLWNAASTKEPVALELKDVGGFDVTDVASLEDGSLIVLERRFRWLEGLNVRLRLIAAKDLGAGSSVAGETLLQADLASEIDNMEGLAVSRDATGTLVLTLISDDNFNPFLQRNLLLQFSYPDDPARSLVASRTAKARP